MTPVAIQLQDAMQHHAAGRMAEAEARYRQILERDPECAGALHLLGVAHAQQGKHEEAIPLIRRAVELSPGEAAFHSNLALAYVETGRGDLALAAAQRSVQLNPNDPGALNNLGSALRLVGRDGEAISAFLGALRLKEDFSDALRNLARVYQARGLHEEAAQCLRRALKLRSDDPQANLLLGAALHAQKRYPEAIAALEKAIAAADEPVPAYNTLSAVYQEMGRLDEAEACCRKAIAIDASHFAAYNNLGLVLSKLGRIDEAVESYLRSIALRPDNPEAWNNLANAHLDRLEIERAFACYDKANFFNPDHVDAHWNRSLLWLLVGEFEKGWQEYEWRWLRFPQEKRAFDQPRWDGFDIAGKTILLHAEQGLGDVIQFVRYAAVVAARGATVILECQPAMARLLASVPGVSSVIVKDEALPAFDAHCPLMGVPYAVGTNSVESIPASVPYISPDEELARQWGEKLGEKRGKRIGLAWAGSPIHAKDRARSIPLEKLSSLLDVKGVQIVSLQKQRSRVDEAALRKFEVMDLTAELGDFADTAALVANVDLVITVDTAVAHLAGAMGKPVWILLPFAPDWRWLLGRVDSPWYPTARLMRQPRRDDWESVIARVVDSLKQWSSDVR